ncbi:MAG TPA: NirA family protein, partial [Acidimicrobiia bacterium]|nr:NirA family protein [Acidimicrobiia bacterium]
MATDFTPEQKRYLEGFASGISAARVARGGSAPAGAGAVDRAGPDAGLLRAQDRVLAAGGKLSDQEKVKRQEHPFDAYGRLRDQAARNEAPKPPDSFRWRYYGLFFTAPTQAAYMCRLRMPNGILTHWQLAGIADLADRYAGGYAHVTTRANLQLREIEPRDAVTVIEAIADLGLTSRGSGVDNIRNVTGTPTAGVDPRELIDTRPYARELHFHILNDRSLYGLPRKFNVAFDGGGTIAALEDTNDIGFQAVKVTDGFDVEPGVYFRLILGGITGHRDFGRETGTVVRPADATPVADAILRVFIERGDRTDRARARLKYVLDDMGVDAFLVEVEAKLGAPLPRLPPEALKVRAAPDRQAHVGVHAQRQEGLNWIGVALLVGHLSPDQMRGLAKIAADLGDGEIRLTVWQNLLLAGVADGDVALAVAAVERLGLTTAPTSVQAGMVACTGNVGCKFAATDTKRHAGE